MSRFGEELRRERELRRITLREVSEATKISLRHLEALERNDFQHLPGGVFNRGFVRAYSQFIGVDPEAMVNSYLLEQKSQDAKHNTHEQSRGRSVHRTPQSPTPVSKGSTRRRWGMLLAWGLALLILIGALIGAVYFVIGRTASAEPGSGAAASRRASTSSSRNVVQDSGAAESNRPRKPAECTGNDLV
jgi:cytoskeleton protein RodZ